MKLPLSLLSAIIVVFLVLIPINAEAKTYENERYSFEYPNGCKLEKIENRFSTTDATLECKGDIGINFESTRDLASLIASSSDDDLVDTMETVMDGLYENYNVVETGTDKYVINNRTAPYVLGTFDQEFSNAFGLSSTEPWVLLTMTIRLNDDEPVLVQYRNNEDDFDKDLPMVEKILRSIEVIGNGAETETDNSFTSRGDDSPKTSAICDTVTSQSGKDLCETLLN